MKFVENEIQKLLIDFFKKRPHSTTENSFETRKNHDLAKKMIRSYYRKKYGKKISPLFRLLD